MSSVPAVNPQTPIERPRNVLQPTIATASTSAELNSVLSRLKLRRATVTRDLDRAIGSHGDVARQLSRLDLTRARLGTLSNSTRALSHGQLSGAAATASKLSEAVSRLDLEQERVKATLAVVEQVAELKSCVLGVVGSMGAPQDWETAAEYLHRASRIPREIVESDFAGNNVPTAEVPDPPAQTLDSAAESLCRLFLREFEKAIDEGDGAKVTRFFKMFPLISRTKEGLDAYGRYVCQGVTARARTRLQGIRSSEDGTVYVQALTKLFEHIAQVVDGHSNLVQRHYGPGTMIRVMERLHGEAAVQGGIVLDTWWDERGVERKLTEVKSYAYSFLVQSFLPVPGKGSGTPRSRSPAPGRKQAEAPEPQDEGIDIREVDQMLAEIAAMLGPWSLYLRFCASRAAESEFEEVESAEIPPINVPAFITNSNLPPKIERNLIDPFKNFATFILRRSVERAFQVEDKPTGLSLKANAAPQSNGPFITSTVDDIMYMVRHVVSRTLATSQAGLVVTVAASIGRVLGSDFIGMMQRKMRDEYYPQSKIQGAMPPEQTIIMFLLQMNNLDVATTHFHRILREHVPDAGQPQVNGHTAAPRSMSELFPLGKEATNVHNALTNLETTFNSKAGDLIEDGMKALYKHVVKPRMQPLITEMFGTTSYAADEDSGSDETGDQDVDELDTAKTVAQRGWDARMKPLKRILTEGNASRLVVGVTRNFSALLEQRIWSYHGRVTQGGAVKLERDVADIASVVVAGENFRLRESFNRCLEIVSVMNMDEEEWAEMEAEEAEGLTAESTWALSSKERHRARTMILDRG